MCKTPNLRAAEAVVRATVNQQGAMSGSYGGSAGRRRTDWPGQDGIAAAAELRRELPDVRVLFLTTFGRPGYLRRAMQAGAAGFVLKDAPAEELAAAVRRVRAGERVIDVGLAAAALSEGESPLTAREREVLAAAREHGTAPEVAAALHLSAGTVRNYLSSAMQKLGARSRGEAIQAAEDQGWL